MEIKIQSIHFDADTKLLEFTEKKVNKLSQFFDHIITADVYFRLENGGAQVKDKVVDLKLNLPGSTLYASDTAKSFEEAVDNAANSMERQLKKYKEKLKS